MIVLHAGYLPDKLLLWGEAPAEDAPRRARSRQKSGPAVSPFDAGKAALLAALDQAGESLPEASAEPVVAWLPSAGKAPLAGSPLLTEAGDASAPTLAAWTVTALALPLYQALGLLGRAVDRHLLARGVVIGSDLQFWAAALRLAGSLVARQQFLPGLSGDRACWRPLLQGPDALRAEQLAAAMPGACRCLSRQSEAPPSPASLAVLIQFLEQAVDALVRSSRAPTQTDFDSAHQEWMHRLRSRADQLQVPERELSQLREQVEQWQRPLALSASAPFRLCLRLEEPERGPGDEEPGSFPAPESPGALGRARSGRPGAVKDDFWRVRYLLQANRDPSLLIPAQQAWRPTGELRRILNRDGFDSREYLLTALGQASGLSPEIEQSLRSKNPEGYALNATGAFGFLSGTAAALELAGFRVLLPAWWSRKGTRARLALRAVVKTGPAMRADSGLHLENLVEVDWTVALGGESLSLAELETLAELKAPLVRLRGQWVQLSAEEIQAALEFWRRPPTTMPAREVLQLALGAGRPSEALPFDGVDASGWIRELLTRLETGGASFEERAAPPGFQGSLRPYQQRGYSWLAFLEQWGLGACLADDMGLGKTVQTLALVQGHASQRPVLLVCPTSLVSNWQKEAERFTPGLAVLVHHGGSRVRGKGFKAEAERHRLVLASYAMLLRDRELLESVSWAGVILDEAQNIKNSQTRQAKAARSLPAGFRIALTGTPVENNVGDLYSILEFLNPGLLGTQAEFRRRYFIPIQADRDPEAMARLKRISGPFILRRLKTDKAVISDLPEKLEMKVFCPLTREQASLYAAVAKEALQLTEASQGIERKGRVLAAISKLKQVCNHPAQFLGDKSSLPGRSGKLARLEEMLEEVLEVGEAALVFTQFAEMGALLRRHLQESFGEEVLFLHGATPASLRTRMVERFQADGGPRIFLLSLKAGGTGLNLTRASHVFHYDRWWNPAVEDQATDRAFRIGQTRRVQVHKFVCSGTFEEKIDQLIESKREVASRVVGTGEGWLTRLDDTQLRELFALRAEAVAD